MFEKLRRSLQDAMSGQTAPARVALMRDALVEAKIALKAVRDARERTRAQLARERSELETVRRRGRLAGEIRDEETVRIAARFEQKHVERIAMLERKLAAQGDELALAEREVEEMSTQYRTMASAVDPNMTSVPTPEPESPDAAAERELDALRRAAERQAHDAEAERRLAELKRRMGR